MENLLSPEYGKQALSKIFKDVIIRDYSKIDHCKDKYPIWGVTVLAYSERHRDLNARIQYLPSNKITFEIEMYEGTRLKLQVKHEEMDVSIYDYFIFTLNKMMNDIDDINKHLSKLQSLDWLKLQLKLSKII